MENNEQESIENDSNVSISRLNVNDETNNAQQEIRNDVYTPRKGNFYIKKFKNENQSGVNSKSVYFRNSEISDECILTVTKDTYSSTHLFTQNGEKWYKMAAGDHYITNYDKFGNRDDIKIGSAQMKKSANLLYNNIDTIVKEANKNIDKCKLSYYVTSNYLVKKNMADELRRKIIIDYLPDKNYIKKEEINKMHEYIKKCEQEGLAFRTCTDKLLSKLNIF